MNKKKHDDSSEADLSQIQATLHRYAESHSLHFRILVRQESFSRGHGLQYGATESRVDRPAFTMEETLFFCDVDMIFNEQFMFRCRANSISGNSAYFPIPFSLFKTAKNTSVIHPNGDWRKYGLGMVCMSYSDFLGTGGYSKTITGWGREDVDFYEKLLKNTTIQVMRSIDEGLVHRWHPKVCDETKLATADQMQDCIQSKADWEGDKLHLARKLAVYEQHYGELRSNELK